MTGRRFNWDDLPQDLTLRQLSDTCFALGITLRVRLVRIVDPFLDEAWRRKARHERQGDE